MRRFVGGQRIDSDILWNEYTEGKQTYKQLALKYHCSSKTIQRKLDTVNPQKRNVFTSVANVLMDTTYFGRGFGVMVFKDDITKQILFKQYVKSETNLLYLHGIQEVARKGIKIQSIICDGRKGLFQMFHDIPVQMCQFHQVAIVRRYITKKPKLQASKDLWAVVSLLTQTDKESFVGALGDWHDQWESFLNERKVDSNGKKRYVHKRLRSAYRSLSNNMQWLFTWYDYYSFKIPNTTNSLDGQFSDLKNKLRNHNGLSIDRKKRFIDEFFKA